KWFDLNQLCVGLGRRYDFSFHPCVFALPLPFVPILSLAPWPIDLIRRQSTSPRKASNAVEGSWPASTSFRHRAKTGASDFAVMRSAVAEWLSESSARMAPGQRRDA